jgi:hypothetical protein
MIHIKRAINGISINGTEYLLTEDSSKPMEFKSITEAKAFLISKGVKRKYLDDFIYEEAEVETLKGKDIQSCHISYENLVVLDKKGNKYYIAPKNFWKLMEKVEFQIEVKRTRKHLTPM